MNECFFEGKIVALYCNMNAHFRLLKQVFPYPGTNDSFFFLKRLEDTRPFHQLIILHLKFIYARL